MMKQLLKIEQGMERLYNKKAGLYLLSAVIPMLIMLNVWIVMGVFPFGDKTLMSIDFGQQYISLYQFFKRTILEWDWSGFFYSFSKSIGGSMIGIWGFNLISPFNLIYVLLPTDEFRWGIVLTIWLRYAATGLAFAFLLIKRYNGHTSQKRFLVPIMSTVYALSGMIVAYQMNPIFYDAMIMLPIVIVYLEKLLDEESGWQYTLLLMLTLMLHFYMGYMICLFIALYTVFYLLGQEDITWRAFCYRAIRALIYSILGVGLILWLLYPIFLNLLISKGAYENHLTFDLQFQIEPLDILAKFMIGAFDSQSWPAGPNLPNVFIGSLGLFGSILFFFKKDISKRQKYGALMILVMFFIAIVNVFFNKIWHMGQTPAGFFYRFSWILSFFMVLLSYRALQNWSGKQWQFTTISVAFIYLAAEWTLTHEFSFFELDTTNAIVVDLQSALGTVLRVLIIFISMWMMYTIDRKDVKKRILIGVSAVILFVLVTALSYREQLVSLQVLSLLGWIISVSIISTGFKRTAWWLVSLMTIFELGLNAFIAQSRMGYDNAYQFRDAQISVKEVIDQIRPSKQDEFYRINKTFERSKNDPFMYDYPGLSHFSSNMERSTLSFMTNVGDSGSNASSFYGNGTVFMDAFYGVRYVVDYLPYTNDDVANNPHQRFFSRYSTRKDLTSYYDAIWQNDRYIIYENTNVLPIAFGVNTQTTDLVLYPNQVIQTHNQILSAIAEQELEVYKRIEFDSISLDNVIETINEYGQKIYKKENTALPGTITVTLIPTTSDTYYINAPLALKRQKGGATEIRMNGRWYEYQHSFDGQQLWNIAHNQPGELIEFSLEMGTTEELNLTDFYPIIADQAISETIIEERMKQGMTVESWGNNFVKGQVTITDDSTYMMTSIPFNYGWTVKVDGAVVETKEVWEAFLAFPISSGTHTIELTFVPQGWYSGWIMSGISCILLIIFVWYDRRILNGDAV